MTKTPLKVINIYRQADKSTIENLLDSILLFLVCTLESTKKYAYVLKNE